MENWPSDSRLRWSVGFGFQADVGLSSDLGRGVLLNKFPDLLIYKGAIAVWPLRAMIPLVQVCADVWVISFAFSAHSNVTTPWAAFPLISVIDAIARVTDASFCIVCSCCAKRICVFVRIVASGRTRRALRIHPPSMKGYTVTSIECKCSISFCNHHFVRLVARRNNPAANSCLKSNADYIAQILELHCSRNHHLLFADPCLSVGWPSF